jgi:hypothetical protein
MLCGYLIFLITGSSSSSQNNWESKTHWFLFGGGGGERGKVRIGGSLGLVMDHWVWLFQKPHRIHNFHRKNQHWIRKVIDFLNFSKK